MQLFSAFSLRLLKNQKKIKMSVCVFVCGGIFCSFSSLLAPWQREPALPLNLAIQNLTVIIYFFLSLCQYPGHSKSPIFFSLCRVYFRVFVTSDIRHTYEFPNRTIVFQMLAYANLPSNITQGHDYLLVGRLIISAPLCFITILSRLCITIVFNLSAFKSREPA